MLIHGALKHQTRPIWAVALGLVLLALGICTGHAATILVTNTSDNGGGSLRAALAASTNGDIIDLTGITGTITLTTGELLVTNDVKILGPGPDKLAVDGNFPNTANRVFRVLKDATNGINVTLSGLTISNGNASFGGGIQNYRSALTISNCVISGNQATFGAGGILSSSGYSGTATLTIINSALHRNFGGDVGGAIYQDGQDGVATLVLINSTISSNWVGTVGGAGIKNDGSPTGNAIAFITNCTFIGNSAAGRGGAIQNDGVGGSVSLTVVNTTFIGNSAGASDYGGAIFNDGTSRGHADATFINTTFSGNSAFLGGAICDSFLFGTGNMPLTLMSCTFKDNLSTNGGSIYNLDKLTIGNTILSVGISGTNISGSTNVISMGYNLSSDSANGVLTNVTDQINTDPLLDALQNNGGPVLTHAPLPGSPAIDRGKNLSEAIIDARGFPRMFDDPAVLNASGGDGTDIGAFETFELRITAIEKFDELLGISFTSLPGKTYELQSRSDLNSPTWIPLPGSYPGNGAIAQINLTNSPGQPQQYYRVHQLP